MATRVQVGGRSAAIVGIPGQPGEYIAQPILPDLMYIIKTYKVKVTDGFATSGHSAAGEHPVGLGVDLIPDFARGGTWADLERLARDAGWRPNQPSPGKGAFRWIGWNTEANHGSGNHLHLSWHGKDGPLGSFTKGGSGGGFGLDDIAGAAADAAGSALGPVGSAAVDVFDGAGGAIQDVAGDTAKAIIGLLIDALGDDAARIALYPALVFAGVALTAMGVARMVGVKPTQVATAVAMRRAPTGKAAT